jgi:hypothetical protein
LPKLAISRTRYARHDLAVPDLFCVERYCIGVCQLCKLARSVSIEIKVLEEHDDFFYGLE